MEGAEAWHPDGVGSIYPASGDAGSAEALGPDVFQSQRRVPAGTVGSSSRGAGAAVHRRRLRSSSSHGPSTVSPRKFAAVFFRNSICQSAADADCTPPAIRPDPFAAAGGMAGPAGGRRHYADQVRLFPLISPKGDESTMMRRPDAYFQRARLKY